MYKEHGWLPDGREWAFADGYYVILPEREHRPPEPYNDAMLDILFED